MDVEMRYMKTNVVGYIVKEQVSTIKVITKHTRT